MINLYIGKIYISRWKGGASEDYCPHRFKWVLEHREFVASIWLQPVKSGWQGGARENSCSLLYNLVPV